MWAGWALCADVHPTDAHHSWEHGVTPRNTYLPSPASVSTSTPQSGGNCNNPSLQSHEGPRGTSCVKARCPPSECLSHLPTPGLILLALPHCPLDSGGGVGSVSSWPQFLPQGKDGRASSISEKTWALRGHYNCPRCPSIQWSGWNLTPIPGSNHCNVRHGVHGGVGAEPLCPLPLVPTPGLEGPWSEGRASLTAAALGGGPCSHPTPRVPLPDALPVSARSGFNA